MSDFKVGDRVLVSGRNVIGEISYIGNTHFLDSLCYGITLDEPKGRNNGSFEGIRYFKCPRNHGIFVRACQIQLIPQKCGNKARKWMQTRVAYPNYLKSGQFSKEFDLSPKRSKGAIRRGVNSTGHLTEDSSLDEHNIRAEVDEGIAISQNLSDKGNSSTSQPIPVESLDIYEEEVPPTGPVSTNRNLVEPYTYITDLERKLNIANKTIKTNKIEIASSMTNEVNLRIALESQKNELYALRKKINKLNRDLTSSEKKRKTLDLKLEEFHEVAETVIVEKEIAEVKTEELEMDMKEVVQKCKALELELKSNKEEMTLHCKNGVPSVYYVKHLENHNQVLHNALMQLKSDYILQKNTLTETKNDIQNHLDQIKDLTNVEGSLRKDISKMKDDMSDMHETIDCLGEADNLVFEVSEHSLNVEDKIQVVLQKLYNMEEQLEVSNELEDVLQQVFFESDSELEATNTQLNSIKSTLEKAIRLICNQNVVIEKYRDLVFNLRHSHEQQCQLLESVTKEKDEAVLEKESLKLKFQRENRIVLQRSIEDDMEKIELDNAREEIECWKLYLPDNFVGSSEHRAFHTKLLISKIIKKVELLSQYIVSKCFDFPTLSGRNQLLLNAFGSRFLIKICELQRLLQTYLSSLNYSSVEIFLSSSKYYELFEEKEKLIDQYLYALSNNEIDSKSHIETLTYMVEKLTETLDAKRCPDRLNRLYKAEQCLKNVSACCLCLSQHLNFINTEKQMINKYLKSISKFYKSTSEHVNCLMQHIKDNSRFAKFHLKEKQEKTLTSDSAQMLQIMELWISICEKPASQSADDMSSHVERTLLCMKSVSLDTYSMRYLMSEDGPIDSSETEHYISPLVVEWLQNKKSQQEKRIKELYRKVYFYQQKLANVTQYLEMKEKTKPVSTVYKQFKDKGLQTMPIRAISIRNTKYVPPLLSQQLEDMKNTVRYLQFQLSQCKTEQLKGTIACLKPLTLPSKPRCTPYTRELIFFQKKLRDISTDLKKILFPQVVDLTQKMKSKDLMNYIIQRGLLKICIMKRVAELAREMSDFKHRNTFR